MGDRLMCYRRKLSPMEIVDAARPLEGVPGSGPEGRVLALRASDTARSRGGHDQEAANEAKWLAGHYTPDGPDTPHAEPLAPPDGTV